MVSTCPEEAKDTSIVAKCEIPTQDTIESLVVAQLVECSLGETGGHGFDPGPRHTKVVKNGTSCSLLGTQTYGVEIGLVNQCQDNVTGRGFMSSV